MLGAMAQFEADLNSERAKEAYQAKRAAGGRWERPSLFHDPKNVAMAKACWRTRHSRGPRSRGGSARGRNVLYAWFPGEDPHACDGTNGRSRLCSCC